MTEPVPFEARLTGELTAAPRPPAVHALLLVTGISLVVGGARAVGRLALGYRRPAEVRLTERGLEVRHETKLLGRNLGEGLTIVPLGNLASVAREVRYARLGVYAGIVALVLGTYVGAGLLVDGARVPGGSPSLLGMGLGLILGSALLDFVLVEVVPAATKTCRVVVSPYHGRALCLEVPDPAEADRVLARVQAAAAGRAAPVDTDASVAPSAPASAAETTADGTSTG
ncbi:MAG TPA: hypothetical protein VHE30_11850 [Polyangiaceae bacterium]|nr:hypothetical protein [Polyangiaceae bacterium]